MSTTISFPPFSEGKTGFVRSFYFWNFEMKFKKKKQSDSEWIAPIWLELGRRTNTYRRLVPFSALFQLFWRRGNWDLIALLFWVLTHLSSSSHVSWTFSFTFNWNVKMPNRMGLLSVCKLVYYNGLWILSISSFSLDIHMNIIQYMVVLGSHIFLSLDYQSQC